MKRSSDVAFLPCASEDLHDFKLEDLFTMFCYFAPVTRHSFQAMCTMFSRKDFFRFVEPRCLTSLGGHDGAICHDLWSETPRIGPRTSSGEPLYGSDYLNFLRRTKYFLRETNTVFRDTNNSLQGTKYPVQSGPSFEPAYSILNNDSSHKFIRTTVYLTYLITGCYLNTVSCN